MADITPEHLDDFVKGVEALAVIRSKDGKRVNPMPEPTPTTRDRELALRALDNSPLIPMEYEHYLVLRDQVEAVVGEARREGMREVYQEIKRMLSRHVSTEGRTVLGQLCGQLKRKWPGIQRRAGSQTAPSGAEE